MNILFKFYSVITVKNNLKFEIFTFIHNHKIPNIYAIQHKKKIHSRKKRENLKIYS
jgi:hypothetical protein